MAAWWLLGLAIVGAGVAAYFVLIYYGRVRSRRVPAALCREEEQTCPTVLQTPYARLLGVPNALLGLGFYFLIALAAVLALAGALPFWLWLLAVIAAGVTVLLAPYLIWALLARLKVWCGL